MQPTPPPPLEDDEDDNPSTVAVEPRAVTRPAYGQDAGLKPTPPPPLDETDQPSDEPPWHAQHARAVKKTAQHASPPASEEWVKFTPKPGSPSSEVEALKAELARCRASIDAAARSPGGTATDSYAPLTSVAASRDASEQLTFSHLARDVTDAGLKISEHVARVGITACISECKAVAPSLTSAAAKSVALARNALTPYRTVLLAFAMVGVTVGLMVRHVTSEVVTPAAIALFATGAQAYVHHYGMDRVTAAFTRFVQVVVEHSHVVVVGLLILFFFKAVSGKAPNFQLGGVDSHRHLGTLEEVVVRTVNFGVGNASRFVPSMLISPPPSPPAELAGPSDYLIEYGKRPPRADLLTPEQASKLFVELLAGNEQPPDLPASARCLVIADTGCGRSMGNHPEHFEPGSLYDKKSSVLGIGGNMTTKKRGHMRLPLETRDHGVKLWKEPDAILNPACPFALLAIGRASITLGVSFKLPAWGEDGYFEYPSGVQVTILNRNVTVCRPIGYKESPSVGLTSCTPELLGVPAEGKYGLYIGSGERRAGDVGDCVGDKVPTVCIDLKIGGKSHNLLIPSVATAVVTAAVDPRCAYILISVDCSTWSAAHFLPMPDGSPGRPMRDGYSVLGFTGKDGELPRRVREANTTAQVGADIAGAGMSHGARVIGETPACRRDGCGGRSSVAIAGDALKGAEKHVYMFDHPAWACLVRDRGATVTVTDQCMFGGTKGEKATALFASPSATTAVELTFGGKRCNHTKGTHAALRGVGTSGAFMTVGSETYPPEFCAALARCLMPTKETPAELACAAGVLHGKRTARASVTHEYLHNTFNHSETRVLKHLSDALSDVPQWTTEVLQDCPCDTCLRAEAPKVGPSGHLPNDDGLWFLDIYHTQIPGLWKGEKIVVGFTNAKARLFRSWIVKHKSEADDAVELCVAYCNSKGIKFTWIHADGAHELKGSKIGRIAKTHGFRITTNCPGVSRQSLAEPMWRVMSMYVRKALEHARLPLCFWVWLWRDCEEAYSLKPSRSPPHDCALGRALGRKPKGFHRRPPGCLGYITIALRHPNGTLVNKAAVQAVRCIYLGYVGNETGSFEQVGLERCMPGYAGYIASDDTSCGANHAGTIHISPDMRFVPSCFPGLKRCAGGGGRSRSSVFLSFITRRHRLIPNRQWNSSHLETQSRRPRLRPQRHPHRRRQQHRPTRRRRQSRRPCTASRISRKRASSSRRRAGISSTIGSSSPVGFHQTRLSRHLRPRSRRRATTRVQRRAPMPTPRRPHSRRR